MFGFYVESGVSNPVATGPHLAFSMIRSGHEVNTLVIFFIWFWKTNLTDHEMKLSDTNTKKKIFISSISSHLQNSFFCNKNM